MKRGKMQRAIGIGLVIAMLGGSPTRTLAWGSGSVSEDPFAQMVDEMACENQYNQAGTEGLTQGAPESADFLLVEEAPDAGKTDRYIVCYRDTEHADEQFQEKTEPLVEETVELAPGLLPETGRLSVYAPRDLTFQGRSVQEARVAAELLEEEHTSPWKVLILREEMLPSEFAAELQALGADRDILYIQPDYALTLDGLELELVDGEGAEALDEMDEPSQATAPEPEEPAAAPDPEETGETKVPEQTELPEEPEIREELEELEELEEPEEGREPIVIAVIDTGMDTGHNLFNGYLYGAAVQTATDSLSYAHGTHVAGIILQAAKEQGVEIQILPIRVFQDGVAYTSDIIAAIQYAEACGAKIINCSFGSIQENRALYEAMAGSGALFVCAAGNSRRDFDKQPSYPAGYDLPNVISVASVNADGGFSYFSNYGTGIDIAALGRDVRSALPGNTYGIQTGTSMSAAYVTGVAACAQWEEAQTAAELRERILAGADRLANLAGKVQSGRRVNLTNAVAGVAGARLTLHPQDDFDVHGYQPTDEESWQLFSSTRFTQVAAGEQHALALAEDGTVWAWGNNSSGRLGDGTQTTRGTPRQVVGLTNVVEVSAGAHHSLALKEDGTVWAWGYNYHGQLGDGSTTQRITPVQVSGLTSVSHISAGNLHSLALKADGTVWAWGFNYYGQLGNNNTINQMTPVKVTGLANITAVFAGGDHSLALKTDGTVWAWGYNYCGQLGNNSTANQRAPVQTAGLSGVVSIAAGGVSSYAVKSDGTVWAWGSNYYGQLGNNSPANQRTPVQVTGLTNITAISTRGSHALAVQDDGTVWAWGYNGFGQLGDGTAITRSSAAQVNGLGGAVVSIAAGRNFSLALKSNGSVWAWGSNANNQLGGEIPPIQYAPVGPVMTGVEAVSARSHTLVLKTDGTVWSCGNNDWGELGDGSTADQNRFVPVSGLSDVTAVSAGNNFSLALTSDGTVWAWGYNGFGQLGNGSTNGSLVPVQIPGLADVVAVSAGDDYSLALKSDGTVWAWGGNGNGQLGSESISHSFVPVQVPGLTGVISITAAVNMESSSVALKDDGTVWCWGHFMKPEPVQVFSDGQSAAAAATDGQVYVLKTDGTALWIAYDSYRPLGISNVRAISFNTHKLALKTDGSVWAWGNNGSGQLGIGSDSDSDTPIQVWPSGAQDIFAGDGYSFLVTEQGELYVWGNDEGRFGLGRMSRSMVPVQVANTGVASLRFDPSSYELVIPGEGTANITLSAKYFGEDSEGDRSADILYALAGAYEGVDINEQTGEVTVGAAALPGTVSIQASCLGYTATAELQLNARTTALRFDPASYAARIPGSGSTTVTVAAKGYDSEDQEMACDGIVYSLVTAYPSVSINSQTGVVTVQAAALPGTVSIQASYQGLTATAELTLEANSSELNLTITSGKQLYVALAGQNMATFAGRTITLTYDPAKLQLIDVAAQAHGKFTANGSIPETGVTITAISPGRVSLTFDQTIPSGKLWSGVITVLEFKALATGSATVSVS